MIYEDITRGELYLHCDDCEWGWRDPEKASDPAAGFLTLEEDFEARTADWEVIKSHGWEAVPDVHTYAENIKLLDKSCKIDPKEQAPRDEGYRKCLQRNAKRKREAVQDKAASKKNWEKH